MKTERTDVTWPKVACASGLLALLVTACAPQRTPAQVPRNPPPSPTTRAAAVRIVDPPGLEALRSAGSLVSEPLGELSIVTPCTSGAVDAACTDASNQRLRDEAARRAANLAVVLNRATAQSYPPQYSVRVVFYAVTPAP